MASPLNPLTALAWLLAMVLSPEALAMQGQMAGRYGQAFLMPLIAALFIHGLNIAVGPWSRGSAREKATLAGFGALLKSFIALPAVAVSLATAVLVSSGFVFNEVFLYWFPNFGFAALMLVAVLVVNLAGPRCAATAQALLTTTALAGLAGLTLVGALGHQPEATASTVFHPFDWRGVGLGIVVLLGYDLIRYWAADHDHRRTQPFMFIAVVSGVLIVWAWNSIVLAHVPHSRLADTSIPHVLAARAVMGQDGRIVMGIVVIAGSLAAVNLLFQAVVRMMAGLIKRGALPTVAGVSRSRPWLPLVVLGGITGLLMATGFAGSDWLDVTLRAGLILWLVGLGLDHLPPLLSGPERSLGGSARMAVHLALAVSMTALGIVLVVTDEAPDLLVRALLTLISIAAVLATVGMAATRRWAINRHRKASHPKEGVLQ